MLFLIDLFFSNLRPSAITPSVNGTLGYKVTSPTLYSEIKIENDTLCIRCLKNDNHFYELEVNADAIIFYSVVDGVWTELWKK